MKWILGIVGLAIAAVAGLYFLTRKPAVSPTTSIVAAQPPPSYAGNKDAQNIQAGAAAVTALTGLGTAIFGLFGDDATSPAGL